MVDARSSHSYPVAAPNHPLARAGRNPPGAGRDYIQLVLADRSGLSDGKDRGVIGLQTWRLADLGSKHMLLREGIGWGYMPEPFVHEDIDRGRLVRLDIPEYKASFGCTRSTAPIPRRVQRPPGSLLGSRLKRKYWPSSVMNTPRL